MGTRKNLDDIIESLKKG